ncbi:Glucosamine 6-phosphate N-acetyltransferase [Aphelenchoides bicaudatus]|nr:Glucosamine 6-phosphate N-acetyltransferase [Aphelenchoides bicaudatus]
MALTPNAALESLHRVQSEAARQANISTDSSLELFPSSEIAEYLKDLPEEFEFRPLQIGDYSKNYLDVIRDLTVVGDVSETVFRNQFLVMASTKPHAYFTIVAEDKKLKKIAASITLVLEWKFAHNASARGRIEDVVVHHDYRSKGLARHLNEIVIQLAKKKGVYKISLECKDEYVGFYEKFGYKKDQNFLVQRFD